MADKTVTLGISPRGVIYTRKGAVVYADRTKCALIARDWHGVNGLLTLYPLMNLPGEGICVVLDEFVWQFYKNAPRLRFLLAQDKDTESRYSTYNKHIAPRRINCQHCVIPLSHFQHEANIKPVRAPRKKRN